MISTLYTNCVIVKGGVHKTLNDYHEPCSYVVTMNFKIESGRRIKKARLDKGWTLAELASHTKNLKESRISNYEQGIRMIGPDEAIQLGGALGVNACHLMCIDEESILPSSEKALLYYYRHSDDRGKKTIFSVAESQPVHEGSKKGNLTGEAQLLLAHHAAKTGK